MGIPDLFTRTSPNLNDLILASRRGSKTGIRSRSGRRLSETFNDGPAIWNGTDIDFLKGTAMPVAAFIPQSFPSVGTVVTAANEATFASTVSVDGTSAPRLVLQDTRDWYAWHGDSANVLMADGSVKQIHDLNGDKFFNPGFPVDPTIANAAEVVGYTDGTTEWFAGIATHYTSQLEYS